MKVVALNGSPRGMKSGTAAMIEALLGGFSSQGSIAKHIRLSDMNIAHCSGCYTCWSTTPGVCIHNDDMKRIVWEIQDANVLVFGTPLYFNNVSGTLKDFFDRLTASGGDPRNKNDREGRVAPGYIMVSNCGYPYRSQFEVISLWINRIGSMTKSKILAEFYTTNGMALSAPTKEQMDCRSNYLQFLKDCGRDLARDMTLKKEHEELLTRNILEFS
jgi:multimeric flavodoxin WrbA